MWRADSLEKTLMLGKIGSRRTEEEDDRGRDGWMASPTRWTWVWTNSRSWWWTGKPGALQSRGLQRVRDGWATERNWTCKWRTRQSKEEGWAPREAESGVMANRQETPGHSRSHLKLEETWEDPSREPAEGARPRGHLDFRLLSLEPWANTFLLLEATQFRVVCCNSLGN